MGPLEIKTTLLVLTFGFGLAIIAYPSFADHKGWPVKQWLHIKRRRLCAASNGRSDD